MGRYLFRLPDIGEGVAEAEIVVWHVQPGDVIKEDQSLVDVMTDKATVDMTSPVDGTVTAIHGEVGGMLPVGSVLVEFEVEDEGNIDNEANDASVPVLSEPARKAPSAAEEAARQPVAVPTVQSAPTVKAPPRTHRGGGESSFASPLTRRRAYELGVPLQFVQGTGPGGRVTSENLDAYLANENGHEQADSRYVAREGVSDTPILGLRRKIAERMQDAKRRIPHIAYVEEVDVTQLEALRQDLNANRIEGQPKLTLLPFLMRALVRSLPDFPSFNARYDDEAGILHGHEGVHIGIATQTPAGLMVPVVRHAESLDLWAMAEELARVTQAARKGKASREALSGSTITITSLGALGGIATTPVINHPEVAIISPNKIVERPIVNGSFVTVRKMMNLSSSFDHRIIDGYDAAMFVQRLKRLIEHPALIFMD